MYKYIKDDKYYIDLYDLQTIKECLSYYSAIKGKLKKKRTTKNFEKLSDEELNKEVNKAANYVVNIIKAKRYEHKKQVIHECKEKDRRNQEKIDKAVTPQEVICKKCFSPMAVILKEFDIKQHIYKINKLY